MKRGFQAVGPNPAARNVRNIRSYIAGDPDSWPCQHMIQEPVETTGLNSLHSFTSEDVGPQLLQYAPTYIVL